MSNTYKPKGEAHMDTLLLKHDLSAEQLALVSSELENVKKSKGIAYALWLFTGGVGGHRYYAGDIGIGIAMTVTLGGLGIWALVDGFFIGKRIDKHNTEKEIELIQNVKRLTK